MVRPGSEGAPVIAVDVREGVATITLARPEARNAFNRAMIEGFCDAVDEVERLVGGGVLCVIIRSDADDFSVGGDLKALQSGELGGSYAEMRRIQAAMRRLAGFPCPVITAVQGHAAGAGCSIALCGDIIVAAKNTTLSMAFATAGLFPDFGGLWYLVRRLGPGRAMDVAVTGRRVVAAEALSLGLVDRVVATEALDAEVRVLATELASRAPLAAALTKRAIDRIATGDLETAFELEALAQELLRRSDDHQRLLAAFLDRSRSRAEGAAVADSDLRAGDA